MVQVVRQAIQEHGRKFDLSNQPCHADVLLELANSLPPAARKEP